MARLEDLNAGALVAGIAPGQPVTVVDVTWIGSDAVDVTFKDRQGKADTALLFRDNEATLTIEEGGRVWSFDASGKMLRLVSEAKRIGLAYLFDPLLAVHSSDVDPLPHQITAVYEEMLPRQPLRFLLADDPGAGKTIMTGLFIKELRLRGDLQRCMIVCPGSLVEQWQEEMDRKFDLPFEIYSNEQAEASRTGNWFAEHELIICRLDQLSRSEELKEKLRDTDWDLVVCDEAHKMSAAYYGEEVNYTKRYRLGRLLGEISRHFLLLSATPHNGKEADFQLLMGLLDGDRFEGKFRQGTHTAKTDDLMRRLVKEQLVKLDGRPLFPERRAYTVSYQLSDAEAQLYRQVTQYVREEFGRADAIEGQNRRGTVGFALTILQRRLASSPEAIHQSLKRRRERLEERLREERLLKRGAETLAFALELGESQLDDLDDGLGDDLEETEQTLVSQATAARSIRELEIEVATLKRLEALALDLRNSGTDKKWEQLSAILHDRINEIEPDASRRKLVIFTEQRDTLRYLDERIKGLLGRPDAVVSIVGGMGRDERRNAQARFTHDKDVEILLATDAAGEGINLQRAHLMVNYDLPWNPNRLEQRFGRIHRIGQTEVCHLWNLLAAETREGAVYDTLLKKLEEERKALDGRVFDVLGKLTFGDKQSLRDLMIEAIRENDSPETRARLERKIEGALDREHLSALLESRALYRSELDSVRVREIAEQMARAEAQRLQPHFISAFFREAFALLGGALREREPDRYEITRVPLILRQRDRLIGRGAALQEKYERITFERHLRDVPGKPPAAFVAAGHPLLDVTIAIVQERYGGLLKQGGVLVDPADEGESIRALFYLDHKVFDGRSDGHGNRRVISRKMQFVEIDAVGGVRGGGAAPYLDYEPMTAEERALLQPALAEDWLTADLEGRVTAYASTHLALSHLNEVKERRLLLIQKTREAVYDRLTKEIMHLDQRAAQLRMQEEAGRTPRLNSARMEERAENLQARLKGRMAELDKEAVISTQLPVVSGGLIVVPRGLLDRLSGARREEPTLFAKETARVERIGMDCVMMRERALGNDPLDVSAQRRGYDIESRVPDRIGGLRFIEVKGRVKGAETVTVTKNEILTALNKPDDFILALVEVDGDHGSVTYLAQPFASPPDFAAASVNYEIKKLLASGVAS
ncbi:MAG: helicase-related protein [Thermomicrobiales bacterium]